jgi:hypothetical protein
MTAPETAGQLRTVDAIFEAGQQAAANLAPMSPAMAQRIAAYLGPALRRAFPPADAKAGPAA